MAGLKSLAQELQSKGRNGDTILAHINPQEAGILKALGGSGTINPHTGLPEYFFKSVARIVSAPFKAVNEVIKAVPVIGPAIDKGLVSLDKAVGSAIPGGWNTLAQTGLSFVPGIGLPAKIGLAALGGSGAFGPSGKFNLQRALMSGAMAYGMNQLTAGLQNAGTTSTALSSADVVPMDALSDVTGSAVGSGGVNAATGEIGSGLAGNQFNLPVGDVGAPLPAPPPPSIGSEIMSGNIGNVVDRGVASVRDTVGSMSIPSMPDLGATGTNLSAAGEGIKNLTGFGTGASEAATKFMDPITKGGMTALTLGTLGTMSLDEEQKFLDQQYASGNIAQAEYDAGTARINESRARSEQAMKDNPYKFYAGGGVNYSADDQSGMFAGGSFPDERVQGYSMGGQPRFLSGGGDGMSDSIKANIEGKQEARLADGEFVIPADVVSHLGNGSSKAGAKQLYSMMDRVREARTGNPKQGKEIKPQQYLTA